jgi:TonB family protein
MLKAVIGTDGKITTVNVLSGKKTLVNAALEAVRHWRYTPRAVDGTPTEAETTIELNFRGDDAVSIAFPPN